MSLNNIKATHTYDLNKNIKDIEINTAFILGIDNILLYYIGEIIKDPATLPATFRKFEKIITEEPDINNPIELSLQERHLYTLFALNQMLKTKAKEQNLEIPLESSVTKEDLEEYFANYITNDMDKAKQKLEEISKLIKPKQN